jgi:hypothetical protein
LHEPVISKEKQAFDIQGVLYLVVIGTSTAMHLAKSYPYSHGAAQQ